MQAQLLNKFSNLCPLFCALDVKLKQLLGTKIDFHEICNQGRVKRISCHVIFIDPLILTAEQFFLYKFYVHFSIF